MRTVQTETRAAAAAAVPGKQIADEFAIVNTDGAGYCLVKFTGTTRPQDGDTACPATELHMEWWRKSKGHGKDGKWVPWPDATRKKHATSYVKRGSLVCTNAKALGSSAKTKLTGPLAKRFVTLNSKTTGIIKAHPQKETCAEKYAAEGHYSEGSEEE